MKYSGLFLTFMLVVSLSLAAQQALVVKKVPALSVINPKTINALFAPDAIQREGIQELGQHSNLNTNRF